MKYCMCALGMLAAPAFAAHPFMTEDTGTQGKGRWQLEVNGERNRDTVDDETVRATQAAAVLSHGFVDQADLQVGLPYTRHEGRGDAAIDVKWRFWESGPLSFGLKPGVTLPTGNDDRGLGAGRVTWGSLAIASYESQGWALHSHVGYRRNRNTQEQRESLRHASVLAMYKPLANARIGLDLAFDTNPDPASDRTLRQTVLGAIYSVTKDFDLDAGYRRGNAPAIDRAVMLGATLRW